MSTPIGRRALMQAAGIAGAGALITPGLAGCAAAARVAFNPAVKTWLADLAASIAAAAAGSFIKDKLSEAWQSWSAGANKASQEQSVLGYKFTWPAWTHSVPPTLFFAVGRGQAVDPMNDRLVACVNGAASSVMFDAWAWQGLAMYINDMTSEKEGEDLAQARALCVLGLIPSGTRPMTGSSPQGTVAWMTYQAKNGVVEIARVRDTGGTTSAIVTASVIPDASGRAATKRFTLPTKAG